MPAQLDPVQTQPDPESVATAGQPDAHSEPQPDAQLKPQPDARLSELQAAEAKLLLQTHARNPILFTGGHGCFLTDAEGHDYLDLLSGIGVSALGYGSPVLEEAIAKQSRLLLHTSNLFFHPHTAALALRLTEISGLDRVFFSNSGTEAWEAALKFARAFALSTHAQTAPAEAPPSGTKALGTRFLALEHSFHGRTIGSVATTHKLAYRAPFAPLMPDVTFVPVNDVDALRAAFSQDVCAILVETIQGEGGIHPLTPEFLEAARELCDSTGALLIADEIQSGFGRTGTWFAYQQTSITPDITTLAKPLAGGLPIGATLCTERVAAAIAPGMHGTTFGGGPLATAVAVAVLDHIRSIDLLAHVTEVGTYFLNRLRELATRHPQIVEVRGLGLMIGCELASADLAKAVLDDLLQHHRIILNRTSETVLRFLPPYIIEASQVDLAIRALDQSLTSLTAGEASHV